MFCAAPAAVVISHCVSGAVDYLLNIINILCYDVYIPTT